MVAHDRWLLSQVGAEAWELNSAGLTTYADFNAYDATRRAQPAGIGNAGEATPDRPPGNRGKKAISAPRRRANRMRPQPSRSRVRIRNASSASRRKNAMPCTRSSSPCKANTRLWRQNWPACCKSRQRWKPNWRTRLSMRITVVRASCSRALRNAGVGARICWRKWPDWKTGSRLSKTRTASRTA